MGYGGALRLSYYFSLGFRGFVAALAWLFVPVTLLALGHASGIGPLLGFLGAAVARGSAVVRPVRANALAEHNRFLREAFNVRSAAFKRAAGVRRRRGDAGVGAAGRSTCWQHRDVAARGGLAAEPGVHRLHLPGPAADRVGAGARANRRETPRHWFFRWVGWIPLLPAAAFYVLIVYFTQFTSWNGIFSLYEQHAFLLPVPFFGMRPAVTASG
ncbi:MAG: hypothetical protein U0736_17830 [Gemmataceae bacterium]